LFILEAQKEVRGTSKKFIVTKNSLSQFALIKIQVIFFKSIYRS